MRENLMAVTVTGSSSVVYITLLGHDFKLAAMLDHPAGSGRWIDQYEVKRTADFRLAFAHEGSLVTPERVTVPTLAEAREQASALYREAAACVAADVWARAEAGVPHFHRDHTVKVISSFSSIQDINAD